MQLIDLKFVTIQTFIIQFVLLIIVLYVLNRFVWKPYLKYLDETEKKQKKLEEDYKNIDKLVQGAEEKKETILSEARKKGDDIVNHAESIAKKKKEDILTKAETEAKALIETSKLEIEKERLSMMNSLKGGVIDLILKMNSKLFGEEKHTREYLEKEIQSLK